MPRQRVCRLSQALHRLASSSRTAVIEYEIPPIFHRYGYCRMLYGICKQRRVLEYHPGLDENRQVYGRRVRRTAYRHEPGADDEEDRRNPYTLNRLPVGSIVKFKAPFDMTRFKKGEDITVQKMHIGKSNRWMNGSYYYPSHIIGDGYEVMRRGNLNSISVMEN